MANNSPMRVSSIYDDIDDLTDAMYGWDARFLPLGVANGHFRLDALASPSVMLQQFLFDKPLHQRGAPAEGKTTVGLTFASKGAVRVNDVEIRQAALIIFPAQQEFTSISNGEFAASTITISNEFLAQLAEHYKIDLDVATLSTTEMVLAISAQDASFIDGLIQEALFTKAIEGAGNQRILEHDLPLKVLSILAAHKEVAPASMKNTEMVLSRATKFIGKNASAPISVSDVYQFSNCNERMLQRVFSEHFGLTPVEYIRLTRLNRARKKIKTSEIELSIADIAYDCGLSHPSRFSDYYRQIYGESPSETRRRHIV